MSFVTLTYAVFLAIVFVAYWTVQRKTFQNLLLLVASYVFYGWIHPWFCYLIAASTICDFLCGLGIARWRHRRHLILAISLLVNLGMLAVFKYFNFFAANVHSALDSIGLSTNLMLLEVVLPVGISFYTFQTLSYTIDIWRGLMEPRRNLLDFALFVAFFPQLVAGPIERARRFLPQIETPRHWDWQRFQSAGPLLVSGLLKKMVVADNAGVYVDQIFMLEDPGPWLLLVGSIAFAMQILGDFSGYTDIARGTARLIGFELVENFKSPYLAISPSDFWRRWHISLSSWIRDYVYIPLGGSRVAGRFKLLLVTLTTMGLAGLWHGAAWNFVIWGLFHGAILFLYRFLGFAGRWEPSRWWSRLLAWTVMIFLTLTGWLIFRTPDMGWLLEALSGMGRVDPDSIYSALAILGLITLFAMPLLLLAPLRRLAGSNYLLGSLVNGAGLAAVFVLRADTTLDFIYFQF